ncbi:MAG: TonB-dependent receptor [Chitinophagaceae bacterium]
MITMKKKLLIIFVFFVSACFSQEDSSKVLPEIIVKAFEQNKKLKQTPAAISLVTQAQFNQFSNYSILPALNAAPGVKMEERSPGSYRMNIRGSTLRSPFGVRNVKVYWNNLVFTDAGGNTYLNQLSLFNIYTIEIIKGPAASIYGAGTGGVILIHSQPADFQPGFRSTISYGSYGAFNGFAEVKNGGQVQSVFNYAHQQLQGYRMHSSMHRDVTTGEIKLFNGKKHELQFSVLYGDLYYQTPGGLTKTEFIADPRRARPNTSSLPGADSARAAIFQRMYYSAISHQWKISKSLQSTTSIYGAFTEVKNPTFRNYEKRTEPNLGGRISFTWQKNISKTLFRFNFGGEAQKGFFNIKTYKNKIGRAGDLLTNDDVQPVTATYFSQIDIEFKKDWNFTAGISNTGQSIFIDRISVQNFSPVHRRFHSQFMPRAAVSKKVWKETWLYSSISKGFSSPTVAEVLPSTSIISRSLQPEQGVSYEAGIKTGWLNGKLYSELTAFYYRLKNAIVQRRDSSNADYFINAGSTKQKGIEWLLAYQLFQLPGFVSCSDLRLSYTFNQFSYQQFKQLNNDYSGKKLPGVAPNTLNLAASFVTKTNFSLGANYFFSNKIFLNDLNSEKTKAYHLVSAKLNYTFINKNWKIDFFAGAENLLDETYSLGNDINAAGGRYYNAAAKRNFYAGLTTSFR